MAGGLPYHIWQCDWQIASSPDFIGILAMTVNFTWFGLTPSQKSDYKGCHCEPDEGGRGNPQLPVRIPIAGEVPRSGGGVLLPESEPN